MSNEPEDEHKGFTSHEPREKIGACLAVFLTQVGESLGNDISLPVKTCWEQDRNKGKCEENAACVCGFYCKCLRRVDGRGCEKHVDRIKYNKMASELENSCERNEYRTITIRNCQKEKILK